MHRITSTFKRLMQDESGGEVLEYALVAGLIVIGALSVIGQVGSKVLPSRPARYAI
jgi:Flp pilus assembly pilin Flp